MSTRTPDRFYIEPMVMLGGGGGRVDRPKEKKREASSPESFTSSSISSSNSQAKAAQPSHDTRGPASHGADIAMQHSSPPPAESKPRVHRDHCDHLEHQLATDVARSPLRRFLKTQAIRKLLKFRARWQNRFHATIPDVADKPEDARGINVLQQELFHSGPYVESAQRENDREGNTLLRQARPQIVATIESDRQSASSGESGRANKYGLMMKAEVCDGVVEEVRALFDTGSPDNFIYRAKLDKIGKVKEHPIPPKQVRAYQSALDGDDDDTGKAIVPTSFVRLTLGNEQIGLRKAVDLKILELPGEPGGFQIILGERFIGKHGDEKLLGRVRRANTIAPRFTAPGNDRVAHLRRSKTSKTKSLYLNILKQINERADILDAEQEAINEARDQEQREEDQRLHADTHCWETSLTVPIPPTMQFQSTSMSLAHSFYHPTVPSYTYGDHIQPQIAYPYAGFAVQQPFHGNVARLPESSAESQDGPYDGDVTMQQTAEDSVNQMPDHPADWQSHRTDTWGSQSTATSSAQFTQSSRQSTASSMSTAPSLGPVRMPAKGGRFPSGQWTPQGGVHRESRE
jgi:hypothetical protein